MKEKFQIDQQKSTSSHQSASAKFLHPTLSTAAKKEPVKQSSFKVAPTLTNLPSTIGGQNSSNSEKEELIRVKSEDDNNIMSQTDFFSKPAVDLKEDLVDDLAQIHVVIPRDFKEKKFNYDNDSNSEKDKVLQSETKMEN